MSFTDFIRSLSISELEEYAFKCGTTVGYIKSMLFYNLRRPSEQLMISLTKHAYGKLRLIDVVDHFFDKHTPKQRRAFANYLDTLNVAS